MLPTRHSLSHQERGKQIFSGVSMIYPFDYGLKGIEEAYTIFQEENLC